MSAPSVLGLACVRGLFWLGQAREQYLHELDLLIDVAEQEKADTLAKLKWDYRQYSQVKVGFLKP